MSKWKYEAYIPPRPYVVEKDYGDVVLSAPVYTDSKGNIYIDKVYISELPPDITEEDMDASWIRIYQHD
jgi:hypothetical protein